MTILFIPLINIYSILSTKFIKLFPEFKAIVNDKQDNGCVIFLKNISSRNIISGRYPQKEKAKVENESSIKPAEKN